MPNKGNPYGPLSLRSIRWLEKHSQKTKEGAKEIASKDCRNQLGSLLIRKDSHEYFHATKHPGSYVPGAAQQSRLLFYFKSHNRMEGMFSRLPFALR